MVWIDHILLVYASADRHLKWLYFSYSLVMLLCTFVPGCLCGHGFALGNGVTIFTPSLLKQSLMCSSYLSLLVFNLASLHFQMFCFNSLVFFNTISAGVTPTIVWLILPSWLQVQYPIIDMTSWLANKGAFWVWYFQSLTSPFHTKICSAYYLSPTLYWNCHHFNVWDKFTIIIDPTSLV